MFRKFLIDDSFTMNVVRVLCLVGTGNLHIYNLYLWPSVFEVKSVKTSLEDTHSELDKNLQISFSHFGSKFFSIFMCVLCVQHICKYICIYWLLGVILFCREYLGNIRAWSYTHNIDFCALICYTSWESEASHVKFQL